MATEFLSLSQELCSLISSLDDIAELASQGDAQALETSQQCFDSLKQLQVASRYLGYFLLHQNPQRSAFI